MSANISDQLCSNINICDCISICLDETADINSSARLAIITHFLKENERMKCMKNF